MVSASFIGCSVGGRDAVWGGAGGGAGSTASVVVERAGVVAAGSRGATSGSAALIAAGVVQRKPTSKRDIAAVQDAFNRWREQSGRSLAHISRTLACSVGD